MVSGVGSLLGYWTLGNPLANEQKIANAILFCGEQAFLEPAIFISRIYHYQKPSPAKAPTVNTQSSCRLCLPIHKCFHSLTLSLLILPLSLLALPLRHVTAACFSHNCLLFLPLSQLIGDSPPVQLPARFSTEPPWIIVIIIMSCLIAL